MAFSEFSRWVRGQAMTDHRQLVFGHFRVASQPDGTPMELGRGAMGVTYKAFDERLRIDVALKLIAPAQVNNPKAQTSFLREARAAARVHHSNVASVVYLNDTPGNFFYAMEFVEGQSLRDWMREQHIVPPVTAIALAIQIARGLEAIHEQHLVHRDLKPANVMLVRTLSEGGTVRAEADPDAWRVKIIDFGLARVISQEGVGGGAATQTAGFHGTALYASPEQCEERTDLDGRSDFYSLGCILWEMLCGAPPFRARTHRALMNQHVSEPLPTERLAHLPPSLAAVVARLLLKDPINRFPNAAALVKALERAREKIESGEEVVSEIDATTFDPSGELPPADTPRPPSDGTPAPSPSPTATTGGSRRDLLVAAAAVLALLVPGWMIYSGRKNEKPQAPNAIGTKNDGSRTPARAAAKPKSVAVLPFRNLSPNKENEYFVDGVQEEVIGKLSNIGGLRTISSISVRRYRGKEDLNLREIARELDVDSVVEGSIQRVGEWIQIQVALVDAESEQPIWNQKYRRRLGDDFRLQSEIALDIADGVHANTAPNELREVNRLLSRNSKAQDNYLQARGLMQDLSDSQNIAKAEATLQRAIALDPDFAQAHAQLAILLSKSYDWGEGRTAERQALAAKSAETAIALQPDLPEAQLAMGTYAYRVLRDFKKARPYFERATVGMPGNADLLADALFESAAMERRLGKWTDAVEKFERLVPLFPDDAFKQYTVARTYLFMRRYEDSWRVLEPALRRMPDSDFLKVLKGELFAAWRNDLGPMRGDLASRSPTVPNSEVYLFDKIQLLLFERKFDESLVALRESKFVIMEGGTHYITRDALEAEILTQAGRQAEAKPIWQRAAAVLAKHVSERPDDPRIRMAHALALAGAGDMPDAALREAWKAADEKSIEKDAMDGTAFQTSLALVMLRNGDVAGAAKIVERLRKIPSIVYDSEFNLLPAWDALHSTRLPSGNSKP